MPVRSIALKLGRAMDHEKTLISQRIGSQFTYTRKILNQSPEEYLDRLENDSILILAFVEQWGMTKAEIANYIQSKEYFPTNTSLCADIKCLFDFDVSVPGEPSLRKIVLDKIVQDVKDQRRKQFIYIKNLVLNFDEVKTWLTDEEFSSISNAISEHCPELWLCDIQELVETAPEAVDDIISSSSEDPEFFITHALRLRHAVLARGLGGNEGLSAWEAISVKAKRILLEKPRILFSFSRRITEQFISAEEQHELTERTLSQQDPNLDFLRALLVHRCTEYMEEIKKVALRSKPFQMYLVGKSTSPSLLDIVGFRKSVNIFIENIADLDVSMFDNDQIFSVMNEDDCEKFIQVAKACGRFDVLKLLYKYFDSLHFTKNTKENIEKKIEDLKKRLESGNEKLHPDATPISASDWHAVQFSLRRLHKFLAGEHYTTDEAKEMGQNLKVSIADLITDACIQSPRMIFTPDFEKIVTNPGELIRRDIRAEADVNPQILLTVGHLYEEEWDDLLCQYARGVIFSDSGEFDEWLSNTHIPPKFYDVVKEINPHFFLSEQTEDLAMDIHIAYIEELEGNGWLKVYGAQLRETADKIISEGKSKDPHSEIDSYFRELVDKIGLLDACKGMDEVKDFFINLSEPRRTRLLDKIVFLSSRNIDLLFDIKNLDEFEESIDKTISGEVSIIFGISETLEVKELSAEGVIALTRYWNSLEDKSKFQKIIQTCVVAHLTGNYVNWRNWGDEYSSSQDEERSLQMLKDKRLIPESLSVEQYKAWISDQKMEVEAQLDFEIGHMKNDLEKIIRLAIQDGHIKKELLESASLDLEFAREKIVANLKELQQQLSALKIITASRSLSSEEAEEYRLLQQRIVEEKRAVEPQLKHNLALKCLRQIKLLTVEELKKRAFKIDGKEFKFNYVFSLLHDELGKDTDFSHDIERLKNLLYSSVLQMFGETKVSKQELELTDALDFKTYITIGEEPVASCQSYKDGSMNKGLTSTVVDPAVRVIQVRQKGGKIIARSLLRLLQNAQGEPTLYVERLYSTNSHPKIQEIVNSFAVEKAKSMGIKAFGAIEDSVGSKNIEITSLESKASRAPYVYSDAAGGLSSLGVFSISSTRQLEK
jgi:hypothetical protein